MGTKITNLAALEGKKSPEQKVIEAYQDALAVQLAKDLTAERSTQIVFVPSPGVAHDLDQLSGAWGVPKSVVLGKLLDRLLADGIVTVLIQESSSTEGL